MGKSKKNILFAITGIPLGIGGDYLGVGGLKV